MIRLDDSGARSELAPDGTLRIGLVGAPEAGLFFVSKTTTDGEPCGVTVELGRALAASLDVALQLVVFPNSGECTDALCTGDVAVAFMPVDDERRARLAFGPAYYLLKSTYLTTAASGIARMEDVDHPTVRVIGIANTTTIRAAGRTLRRTAPEPVRSVEVAMEKLRAGEADAFALSHDSLKPFQALLPGSRILDGAIQETSISIAVRKDATDGLAYVSRFLETAKADGTVRAAFDKFGFADEAIAPAGR